MPSLTSSLLIVQELASSLSPVCLTRTQQVCTTSPNGLDFSMWRSKPSKMLHQYHELPLDDEKTSSKFSSSPASSSPRLLPIPEEFAWSAAHERCWASYRTKAVILHLCFVAINLAITAMAITCVSSLHGQSSKPLSLIQSPALDVLEYVRHVYDGDEVASHYIQPPSPEIDRRWQDLILGNFIRLSPQDLQKVGRLDDNPVLLEDGSGVGLVNAHHEIHCIMGLYQASHPEYYWPNATSEQKASQRYHVDHCLDYLLQASMCHGDVGFMTYHWDMLNPIPFWKAAEHTCVNWEGLRGWMKDRRVPIHDPGYLVHPVFGPPYPDGVTPIPTINDL